MRLKETASGSKFLDLRMARKSDEAFLGVDEIVGAGAEDGVHFVVAEAARSRKTNLARSRMKSKT